MFATAFLQEWKQLSGPTGEQVGRASEQGPAQRQCDQNGFIGKNVVHDDSANFFDREKSRTRPDDRGRVIFRWDIQQRRIDAVWAKGRHKNTMLT